MANIDYYERWLAVKHDLERAILDDQHLQEIAQSFIGLKPQGYAVQIIARVYAQYCKLYNQLCDCYDQMEQVQRRPYIRRIIDAVTCRILEVKSAMQTIEMFEFTYPDNAVQQMLIKPQDIEILCPFFYPFEIREVEMQYIMDQIFSGNRIGDPTPTLSEILRKEEERLEEEKRIEEEKEAEMKLKVMMGIEIEDSEPSIILSPKELEEIRLRDEYNGHLFNIQRMERSRIVIRAINRKINKDADMYLELAGLKKPKAPEAIRIRAAGLIHKICRRFMETRRERLRLRQLEEKLEMSIPSWSPPSTKSQLERVKEVRRNFRRQYYESWIQENIKENSRVLRLHEGRIMEDISDELRQWFEEWYRGAGLFDEIPWPLEGGSVLIVRGETFTIPEFLDWRVAEQKRIKAASANPKTKDQIKAEKKRMKEDQKRLQLLLIQKEKKRIADYKKSRLNPSNDPGVYMPAGENLTSVKEAWDCYQSQWKTIDESNPNLDMIRGYIKLLVTETVYQDINIQLRAIVDEMMKVELNLLKQALKIDYILAEKGKPPEGTKRKKPRKPKPPKPDIVPPAQMFQLLADAGIVRKYPPTTLDDYWGDKNYAAADQRSIPWKPAFPPPTLGDVKEQIRIRCILTLGSECENAERTQLLVGPRASGKRSLVYAIANETNALLIDLSPLHVYNKFPGKDLQHMFHYVHRISKLMQPTIIFVDDADKMFYKKVPKPERQFNPTRLSRDFFKHVVKPIKKHDKILVLGTASEPWLAKAAQMKKVFPSVILIPRTDYGSISLVLTKMLMKYHAVDRHFDVHSLAQSLRGFDMNTIINGVKSMMNGKRIAELPYNPLKPAEVLYKVMDEPTLTNTDVNDYEMFNQWYWSYTPWGEEYQYYMLMLESQLLYKIKSEEKKKRKKEKLKT